MAQNPSGINTLYNVCSVYRGIFSRLGGFNTSGDIMSTFGDIMSTSGDFMCTSWDNVIHVGDIMSMLEVFNIN